MRIEKISRLAVDKQEKMKLKAAVGQIPVTTDIESNIKTICRTIDSAISKKADILLTPEGSVSGYTADFEQEMVKRGLEIIVPKASSGNLALALGTCFIEPGDKKCYDQIRFYDKAGSFLGFQSKTLTCGTWDEPPEGEINDYAVGPLRIFCINGITVGALICNDMWANPMCSPMPDPHLSQQLSKMGAKVIFHAVNGGRDGGKWSKNVFRPFHESNLRIRALAGQIWIVTADNCFPDDIACSSPSGVICPDGNWAAKAPSKGEHVVFYTIEIE